jgi:hypothetical protein
MRTPPGMDNTQYFAHNIIKAGEGAQEKAPGTGIYTKDGKYWNIKAAIKYPADDVAEVVTSGILTALIGKEISVSYHFIAPPPSIKRNDQQTPEKYTVSEIFTNNGAYPPTIKSVLQQDRQFWVVGSDPTFERHKKNIQRILEGQELNGNFKIPKDRNSRKRDLGKILAGCLLLGEYDVQVGNLVLYKDKQNNERVASFDHGWGLVDLCTDKHKKIRLFEKKGMIGPARGTHGRIGLPTNHFNDYPDIILSQEFVAGLSTVIESQESLGEKVEAVLQEVVDAFEEPEKQIKQFKYLAEHIGLSLTHVETTPLKVKNYIAEKLKERLDHRMNGLRITKELIKMKLILESKEVEEATKKAKLETSLQILIKVMTENPAMRINDFISKADRDKFDVEGVYDRLIALKVNQPLRELFKKIISKELIIPHSPQVGLLRNLKPQEPLLKTQSFYKQQNALDTLANQVINSNAAIRKIAHADGNIVLALQRSEISLSSSQDNKLLITELTPPHSRNAEENSAVLFAQSLIASGDPNPEITQGSPKKVLALLKILEKSSINPKIDPKVIKNTEMPCTYGGLNEGEKRDFKRIQEILAKRQRENAIGNETLRAATPKRAT